MVFGGLNSVKSHIQQTHCDVFHKCPSCPMAFKSAPSIQSHITSQHPALTDKQTTYVFTNSALRKNTLGQILKLIFLFESFSRMIFKCVMCDTVFTNKNLLHSHFETHLTNQKVHVFKCPECTKLFSQRNSLLEHFKVYPFLNWCLC